MGEFKSVNFGIYFVRVGFPLDFIKIKKKGTLSVREQENVVSYRHI
jgi:hypothetical protein